MSTVTFPVFATANLIKGRGFGHGSRWGIPNASIPCEALSQSLRHGHYSAFASVNGGPVYKAHVIVSWFFGKPESVVIHIVHKFDSVFYGDLLRVCIVDAIEIHRPVITIGITLDDLAEVFKVHLARMERALDSPQYQSYRNHQFFHPYSL